MMRRFSIAQSFLLGVLQQAIERAASIIPCDVRSALERCLRAEAPGTLSEQSLAATLSNLEASAEQGLFACPDTGFPLYYIRIGDGIEVEGGYSRIEWACAQAVKAATAGGRLRKTMVHPLTRHNPGTNVLQHMPQVTLKFDPNIDYVEITAVPKGGGSEIFGTFYRMTTPADGLIGIEKFILDSAFRAMETGKACPPNIVGVGIGGTADLCMRLAKEAAVLRPVGDRHPEEMIAEKEAALLDALNALGIGPMGLGGASTALDVHVEYAATHTAALPVAFNCQCSVCRRATARIYGANAVDWSDYPDWFGRERE